MGTQPVYGPQRLIIVQRNEIHNTFAERPRWRDGRLVSPELGHNTQTYRKRPGSSSPDASLAQMRLKLMMKHLV